jgi:hypothetical protein
VGGIIQESRAALSRYTRATSSESATTLPLAAIDVVDIANTIIDAARFKRRDISPDYSREIARQTGKPYEYGIFWL